MPKEIETVKVVLKNIGRGPQGVNTMNGAIVVPVGATTAELVMSRAELDSARANGVFDIEEKGAGETVMRQDEPQRLTKLGEKVRGLEERIAKLEAGNKATGSTATGASQEKTIAEVLAMGEDKDVPFAAFKAAAAKHLGDKTPNKKDDIVAALEEAATKP